MARIALLGIVALLTGALVSAASAAPPGGGGGGGSGGTGTAPPRHSRRDPGALPQQGESAGLQVGGRVVDADGQPLGGIVVKMFANGMIISSATTTPDGSFEIEGNPQIGGNNTTTLWFQGQGDRFLPTGVILALGSVAAEKKLYPDCTRTVDFLGNTARIEVTMMTLDQRNAVIQESDCLGQGPTP